MTTSLASRQRQREALRRAERVADAAEQAVHDWWRDLLALLRAGPQLGITRLHTSALTHWRRLPDLTRAALRDGLTDLWSWGAESARNGVLRMVPRGLLGRVINARIARVPQLRQAVSRAEPDLLRRVLGERSRQRTLRDTGTITTLTEDRATDSLRDFLFSSGLTGGFPALPEDIPDDMLKQLILPIPPRAVIQQRVDRLIAPFLAAPRPDLVDPQRFASQLIASYSQGKTVQEIAKDLLPIADSVRASARRVARTWGIDIANQSQFEASEQLGPDVIIGYRVLSAMRIASRSWHKARHQQLYLRNPGPGQKGFAQMPHPPREPEDPSERPAGTPWLAWS